MGTLVEQLTKSQTKARREDRRAESGFMHSQEGGLVRTWLAVGPRPVRAPGWIVVAAGPLAGGGWCCLRWGAMLWDSRGAPEGAPRAGALGRVWAFSGGQGRGRASDGSVVTRALIIERSLRGIVISCNPYPRSVRVGGPVPAAFYGGGGKDLERQRDSARLTELMREAPVLSPGPRPLKTRFSWLLCQRPLFCT